MQSWRNRIEGIAQGATLNRLAAPLLFLLLVWFSWRLASVIWWLVAPPQAPVLQPVGLGSQQPTMPDIVRFSLFEAPQSPQTVPVVAPPPAMPQVAIKLEGAMVAGQNSSVILRVNDKPNNYHIGQKLPDSDYRVREIYWNRVVLRDSQGQRRVVKFGDPPLPPPPAIPAAVSPSTGSPDGANPAAGSIGNIANNAANNSANSTGSNNGINQAIQSLQSNRDQYLNQMGVNASGNGIEITDRTPANLRSRLGLRAGDRIVAVNGQRLSGSGNEAQLLEQVKNSGQARIEIQRGEQTMTVQQSF